MSTDEMPVARFAIAPEVVATTHRFKDLREVEMIGSWRQQEISQQIKAYADRHHIGLGDLRAEWTLRIEATGYRLPEEIAERYAEDQESYRRQVEEFVEAARGMARGPKSGQPLAVNFLVPEYTKEPPA